MVAEVLGHAGFGNAKVIAEERLEIGVATARHAGTGETADRDPQRVARFDIVVGGHVVVGEDKDTGAGWSVRSFVQFCGWTGEEAAKLHFEERKPGGESRVAKTTFYARDSGIGDRFDGNAGDGTAIHDARRKNFRDVWLG